MTWDAAPDAPDVHLDTTQVRVWFRLTRHHPAVNTAPTAAARDLHRPFQYVRRGALI